MRLREVVDHDYDKKLAYVQEIVVGTARLLIIIEMKRYVRPENVSRLILVELASCGFRNFGSLETKTQVLPPAISKEAPHVGVTAGKSRGWEREGRW